MDVVEVDLHSREESVTRPASSYNAKDSPPTVKCEVEDTAGHCSPSSIGGFVQVLLPTMKREAEDGKGTMKEENDSLWTDAKHTSPALCMSENEMKSSDINIRVELDEEEEDEEEEQTLTMENFSESRLDDKSFSAQ
ncbi:uncharacterized protein [Periplaneta americana]|uniref:uncharacterized protein isoform X8 n=1 Tax=Periplaneta americana TaxID=6978 RepID=UPI0037E84F21